MVGELGHAVDPPTRYDSRDEDVWRLVFVRRTSSLGDGEEVGNVKAEEMC
jgi:hypothetical protein